MERKIDGYTRVCGLIGNPVEHTMSPAIHNTIAKGQNENLVYTAFRVQEDQVGEAVKGAFALNFLGMNVTVPYKSRVIPYLADIDSHAGQIGAVNTLVRVENGFKGYNTDMPGLYRAFCEDGISVAGEKVIILGAGGVARAVAILLAEKGAQEVIIINRTVDKAEKIAGEVNQFAGRQMIKVLGLGDYHCLSGEDKYLAIQTTNVGMFPKVDEAVIEDSCFYQRIHTGYDLIFNPARTRFMELVEEAGGKAYNGLKMLLYQGIIAYELWTGSKVSDELTKEAYSEMKRAMHLD